MDEKLSDGFSELVNGVDAITAKLYCVYKKEVDDIISNGVTDMLRIEFLFDQIWVFIDDEKMHELFWKLVKHVETFDTSIGAFYRRIEEVHFEGY